MSLWRTLLSGWEVGNRTRAAPGTLRFTPPLERGPRRHDPLPCSISPFFHPKTFLSPLQQAYLNCVDEMMGSWATLQFSFINPLFPQMISLLVNC
jgi:hypothetical protein